MTQTLNPYRLGIWFMIRAGVYRLDFGKCAHSGDVYSVQVERYNARSWVAQFYRGERKINPSCYAESLTATRKMAEFEIKDSWNFRPVFRSMKVVQLANNLPAGIQPGIRRALRAES